MSCDGTCKLCQEFTVLILHWLAYIQAKERKGRRRGSVVAEKRALRFLAKSRAHVILLDRDGTGIYTRIVSYISYGIYTVSFRFKYGFKYRTRDITNPPLIP